DQGGISALARRVGLAPSTISQYLSDEKGRASEPGVEALIKLARGARVSIEWLATGEGAKAAGSGKVPDGYDLIKFFDLQMSGNQLRGMMEMPHEPALGRLMATDELVGHAEISGPCFLIGFCDSLAWEPDIHPLDIMLIAQQAGHMINRPSPVDAWDFIKEDRVYLVADGDQLKLRQLRYRADSVAVITHDRKVERTLTGAPRDFILFGHIAWRSGVLPASRIAVPDHKPR
ncbi:MAG: helix-turn-helix domain-containing protein, partial [Gammaproteobacteria bacterium]